MKLSDITFVSSNRDKIAALNKFFGEEIKTAKIELAEIQSLDLEEVARAKAQSAYEKLGQPVLVEDTGLVFDVWDGLPGPFIRWFLDTVGNQGLCQMLAGFDNRGATATVVFALADGQGVKVFMGSRQGSVAEQPRGNDGFGWDAIFVPEGASMTYAEMGWEEKLEFGVRNLALEQLQEYLKK